MSESEKHRQVGNDWHNSVKDNLDASDKVERLHKALHNYHLALKTATTEQLRCLASSNIGVVNSELTKLAQNVNDSANLYQKQAMKNFSAAWRFSKFDTKQRQLVEPLWNGFVDEFMTWLAGVSPIRERSRCLHDIVTLSENDMITSKMLLRFTQDIFHTGFAALQQGESKECLHCMHECHLPLGRILKIGFNVADCNAAQALKADVLMIVSIAESIQLIRKGDHITSLNGDAMNCYRTAYSKLSQAYLKALNDRWRAKKFVSLANQLSQILAPSNIRAYAWYKEVIAIVENYQQAELAAERLKMENRRKAVHEEMKRKLAAEKLKSENRRKLAQMMFKRNLEELDSADFKDPSGHVDIRKFLKWVYGRFPPKHKEKASLTEDPTELDQPGLKKLLKRAMVDYHPDPINEDQHGNHYKVLYQEICKIISNEYNYMKDVQA